MNFIIFSLLCIFTINYSCNCPSIEGGFDVISIKIDNNELLEDFSSLRIITFFDNNEIMLPFHKNSKVPYPVQYASYNYDAKVCKLKIDDTIQNIFTGEFEVVFLASKPPKVLLFSENLEILLQERGLTIEKPLIPIDWEGMRN